MDTTMIIVIVLIGLLLVYLFSRNRVAPRGTYNDRNKRSSGSIGGGARAYDDPKVESSGSIGGGARAYDAPEVKSGGSIGGGPATRSGSGEENARRPQHDDPNFKSGGSFGG